MKRIIFKQDFVIGKRVYTGSIELKDDEAFSVIYDKNNNKLTEQVYHGNIEEVEMTFNLEAIVNELEEGYAKEEAREEE